MLFKALYNVHIWNDHGRGHYLCYQIFDIIEFSFSIDYSMVYDFKLFWVQFLLNVYVAWRYEVDYNSVEWVNEDYLI